MVEVLCLEVRGRTYNSRYCSDVDNTIELFHVHGIGVCWFDSQHRLLHTK